MVLLRAVLLAVLVALGAAQDLEPRHRPQRWVLQQISECPKICECTWSKATCSGLGLFGIDTGLSNEAEELDLSNNSIGNLEDRQLARAGLTRLRTLNLSRNAINEIGLKAFEDLKNLTTLDLSMNRIDHIDPETFFNNKFLRTLRLSGNKFNLHVPKLHSDTIMELDYSRCRIETLEKENFSGMTVLRKLDLSFNELKEISLEVFLPLKFLRNLYLGKNPWTCGNAMYSLKLYFHSKRIRTDSVCEKPGLKIQKMIPFETPTSLELETVKPIPAPSDSRAAMTQWNLDSWREIKEAEQQEEDEMQKSSGASGMFSTAMSNVSPFWFLVSGFLLGSGATMIFTYLWLTTTISCLIPRIRRAEASDSTDANSQRVSLLRHLWHPDTMASSEDNRNGGGTNMSTSTVYLPHAPMSHSCPGTPPPPYREVMLHRNLYPRAAMTAAAQQATANRIFGAGVPEVTSATSPTSYNI